MWQFIKGKRVWVDRYGEHWDSPLHEQQDKVIPQARIINDREKDLENQLRNIKSLKGTYHDSSVGIFKKDTSSSRGQYSHPCLAGCGRTTSSNSQVCQYCQKKEPDSHRYR